MESLLPSLLCAPAPAPAPSAVGGRVGSSNKISEHRAQQSCVGCRTPP